MRRGLRIGVDVGGTNTDAVVLDGHRIASAIKTPTTADVTSGITRAIGIALKDASVQPGDVGALMIGTTHFINALVERKHLQKTGVLRLCGRATRALPPMVDWPEDLRSLIDGGAVLTNGGVEYDGRSIESLDQAEIARAARDWRKAGVQAIAIAGVFSLVDGRMEEQAAEIVAREHPGAAITLSNRIGGAGLLQRESAAILNASLFKLGRDTIAAFQESAVSLGLTCPLFVTQNDGTLMSAAFAADHPVFAIASGPTNSMRGTAFLAKLKDAIVIDIGGTTTDVGLLVKGFPRAKSEGASIAGVQTNFRIPDVLSLGLGGGSLVTTNPTLAVGPTSVGFHLTEKAQVFGGDTLTATDIAVAARLCELGEKARVSHVSSSLVHDSIALIRRKIETVIDLIKPSADGIPVILVGGGSILVGRNLDGASEVIRPEHHGSANAIGAAIAQVSGEVDRVVSLDGRTRDSALALVTQDAKQRAIDAGADARTVEIAEIAETPLAYLPGNVTRISVKAVGDLAA